MNQALPAPKQLNLKKLGDAAIKAGAKVKRPVENMFWGDRYGQVEDPFGHLWSISTKIEEVTPEQIKERAAKMCTETH